MDLSFTKEKKIKELCSDIQLCHKCERLTQSRNKIVNGYGDLNAQVIFIGEAPGRLGADITGIPFTRDKSGKILQRMLHMIGMKESHEESDSPVLKNAYITNIIRCNPRNADNNNGTPDHIEISNCASYLEQEIKIINPFMLVPLGLTASKVFLGNSFTGKCFGYIFSDGNRCLFPLWHPSFIARGGGSNKLNIEIYSHYFLMIQHILLIYNNNIR